MLSAPHCGPHTYLVWVLANHFLSWGWWVWRAADLIWILSSIRTACVGWGLGVGSAQKLWFCHYIDLTGAVFLLATYFSGMSGGQWLGLKGNKEHECNSALTWPQDCPILALHQYSVIKADIVGCQINTGVNSAAIWVYIVFTWCCLCTDVHRPLPALLTECLCYWANTVYTGLTPASSPSLEFWAITG